MSIIKQAFFTLLCLAVFSAPPAFADGNNPQYIEYGDLNSQSKLPAMTIEDYTSNTRLINIIDSNSFFSEVSPEVSLDSLFNGNQAKNEALALLEEIKNTFAHLYYSGAQNQEILDTWLQYESKLLELSKKEGQINELLDYLQRLKNVAMQKSPPPAIQPQKINCADSPNWQYQYPKCQPNT